MGMRKWHICCLFLTHNKRSLKTQSTVEIKELKLVVQWVSFEYDKH